MARVDIGTLVASVDANTRGYERGMLKIEALTKAVTKSIEKSGDDVVKSNKKSEKSVKDLNKSFKDAVAGAVSFGAAAKMLKIPAIVSAVRPAIAGINALGGGAIIAANSLSSLSGSLVGLPFLLGAVGQGAITAKLAMGGLSEGMKALATGDAEKIKETMKTLPAATQKASRELFKMRGAISSMKAAAAGGFLPGLVDGAKAAYKNLPILNTVLKSTGKTMGNLAKEAGNLVGSKGFGKDFATMSGRNNALLKTMGNSLLLLARSFMSAMVAAKPMTDALTKWIGQAGVFISKSLGAAAASGKLTAFFERSVQGMKQWGHTIRDFGVALFNVFKGGAKGGQQFLDWIEKSAAKVRKWSVDNKENIDKFFLSIQPPLKEAGLLLGDFAKAFMRIGDAQGMAALTQIIRTVRKELLPALEALATGLDPAAFDNIVKLAAGIARFLNMGSFDPVMKLAGAIGELASVLASAVAMVPGLGQLIGTITMLGLASKLVKFSSLITGFRLLSREARGAGKDIDGATKSMSTMSKLGIVGGVILATTTAVGTFSKETINGGKSVDQLAEALTNLKPGAEAVRLGLEGANYKAMGFNDSLAAISDNHWWDNMKGSLGGLLGLGNNMDLMRQSVSDTSDALSKMVMDGNGDKAKAVFEGLRKSWVDSGQDAAIFDSAMQSYKDTLKATGDEAKTAADKIKETDDAVKALNDTFQSQLETEVNWRRTMKESANALVGLKAGLNKNKDGLNLNTVAGQQATDKFIEMARAADGAAKAASDQGQWGKAKSILDTTRGAIEKQLIAFGMSETAAKKYVDQLLAIPPSVTTKINADTAQANANVASLVYMAKWLDGKTILTHYKATGSAPSAKGDGRQQDTTREDATGGYVTGPGTSTSDSIRAWLSNREYVIKASSVAKYGVGFFDKLNAGAYAAGGLVRKFASGGSTSKKTAKESRQDRAEKRLKRVAQVSRDYHGTPTRDGKVYRSHETGSGKKFKDGFFSAAEFKQLVKQYGNSVKGAFKALNNTMMGAANGALEKWKAKSKVWFDQRDQTADQMKSFANVGSYSPSDGQKATAKGAITNMQQRLAAIKKFSANLKTLVKWKLNRTTLRDIIAQGPDAGGQLAQALVDGGIGNIASMNQTQAEINKVANEVGSVDATAATGMSESTARAIRDAKPVLNVHEGAVKINITGADKATKAAIQRDVEKAVRQAFAELARSAAQSASTASRR